MQNLESYLKISRKQFQVKCLLNSLLTERHVRKGKPPHGDPSDCIKFASYKVKQVCYLRLTYDFVLKTNSDANEIRISLLLKFASL